MYIPTPIYLLHNVEVIPSSYPTGIVHVRTSGGTPLAHAMELACLLAVATGQLEDHQFQLMTSTNGRRTYTCIMQLGSTNFSRLYLLSIPSTVRNTDIHGTVTLEIHA